jgi:hypothetical protein
MNVPPGEHTGMLVLRLWRSASEGTSPLGRISHTTDVVNVPQSVTTVGSPAEISEVVEAWLEAMIGTVHDEPAGGDQAAGGDSEVDPSSRSCPPPPGRRGAAGETGRSPIGHTKRPDGTGDARVTLP